MPISHASRSIHPHGDDAPEPLSFGVDSAEEHGDGTLSIDCDECVLQGTAACDDCVVSFICGLDAGGPVVVNLAEARAMRLLGDAGLAPPLRHRRTS
ncbi:MAG: hypothetical protein KDB02_08860 [Acidimicrobiales bacterium]|nr:hypothetical protein [Acidimicrobiales bacterium]